MPDSPWVIFRSSLLEVFFKRGVLENFAKFTGNPLYQGLFFIMFQSSSPQLYLKKRLQHRRFLMNFLDCQEHIQATAQFFSISREVSHYAFFSVDFLIKHLKYSGTKNQNKLDKGMILVGKVVPSASFRDNRKAIFFQNCSGDDLVQLQGKHLFSKDISQTFRSNHRRVL